MTIKHTTQMHMQPVWTDESLEREIAGHKHGNDLIGLEHFLIERLQDNDPCCLTHRPSFWNELGLIKLRQNRPDEAKDNFRNALEIERNNITALYNIGTLALQQNDLIVAHQHFQAVLREKPDHYGSLFNSGLCHLYGDEKEAALPMFTAAARLRPEDGQTHYLTGELLLQLGRPSEALPYFKQAYNCNHGHFETTMGYAITLFQTENFAEAIAICDQALIEFGAATLPLQVKADAMLAMENVEEAVRCHIDLCQLDLDIRNFVVLRVQQLAQERPTVFDAYSAVVRESFPNFESVLQSVRNRDELSQ